MSITEPGVYELDEATYHADPVPWGSLSNSGAKMLLPPSCPALYRYWTDHPRPPKTEYEFGHAAHREVLGVGLETVVVDRDRWDTKAVKEEVAAIRASGRTPLKRGDYDRVQAMAKALREHPLAGTLLRPGLALLVEQSLFWTDPDTEVMRRARLDALTALAGGRCAIVDYKSTDSAEPAACSKAMYSYGYHRQGAWYLDGVQELGLGEDTAFLLVWQEKDPPHLVTVTYPDDIALRAARDDNRRAIDLYAQCVSADQWPGYADDVIPLALPAWAERRFLEQETYA